MNPIQYILYHFFKAIFRFALWVYYSKKTVAGKPHDRSANPCILVSNHPSTMLDPLNVGVTVQSEIFFLANAGLFKNPVSDWLLRKLFCIPIERMQDTGGKPLDNAASFEQVNQFLTNGGCLYVAPEGNSFVERRLRKLKTGTARIALAAESANDFQLGLTILPVGLNYSDPTQFRSELLVVFGKPFPVAGFKKDWNADPNEAVRTLTEAVSDQLGTLIIDCEDAAQDHLLHCLETIFQDEKPLPPLENLQRSQHFLARLRQWEADNAAAYELFSSLVLSYFEKIKRLKISDLTVKNNQGAVSIIPMLAGFPLFILGYLMHVVPTFFINKITNAINGDIHWVPTYKFITGLVLYPLFIWLQTWVVGAVATSFGLGSWVKWAYLLAVIPLGLVAEWWLKKWKRWLQNRRAAFLTQNKKETWGEMTDLRQQILDTFARIHQ